MTVLAATATRNSTLLHALRLETAALHEALDARFSGGLFESREAYQDFLVVQARVLPAIEDQLRRQADYRTLDDWEPRFRSSALFADLADLGIGRPPVLEFDLPPDEGHAAGAAYVIEGGRLGGRSIAARMKKSGLAGLPMRFVGHGAENAYWRSCLIWLESRDADETYRNNAVDAARSTFGLFIRASETL